MCISQKLKISIRTITIDKIDTKSRITRQSGGQSMHRFQQRVASFHGWKRLINLFDQIRASLDQKCTSQIPGKGGKSSVKSETQSALPRKSSKVRLFIVSRASCIARRLKPGIGGIEIGGTVARKLSNWYSPGSPFRSWKREEGNEVRKREGKTLKKI